MKITTELLDNDTDAFDVLGACRQAMETVGKRFEEGSYFLPELIFSGVMFKNVAEIVKPKMKGDRAKDVKHGKIIMGTVEGDIHNIGKDMVIFMLEISGFELMDLGIQQPPARFVDAARDFQPQVVGLSCLLTSAYEPMKATVAALEEAGLRSGIKIMIGGGHIDDQIVQYTGADAFGGDAMAAVNLARQFTKGV